MNALPLPRFAVHESAQALADSLSGLEQALALVAPRWCGLRSPVSTRPGGVEPWGVATNLAHMAIYEELLAAPVLESLAAGRDGVEAAPSGNEDWFTVETEALARAELAEILRRLRTARERQIAAVRRFSEETLNEACTPLWGACWGGRQPAGWVAAKTVQHTWDHGNSVFQTALFAPR